MVNKRELKLIADNISVCLDLPKQVILSTDNEKRNSHEHLGRHLALYALHVYLGYSQPVSAEALGYVNHQSTAYAIKKVNEQSKWNSNVRHCLDGLRETCDFLLNN